jgi:hypothetical protein
MEDLKKLLALTNALDDLGFHLESIEINDLIKIATNYPLILSYFYGNIIN